MNTIDQRQPEIRSKRLVLRALRASDAEALFALFSNWEVVRWLSLPPWPYTLDDARGFAEGAAQRHLDGAEASYAVTLQDALIGGIGVRLRPQSHLQRAAGPNFGFWVGQPYWGRGYMTEAVWALVQQVFARTPCDAIYAGAFVDNVASLRVQEKAGFLHDGETMLHSNPRGGDYPHVNTVLTRARFDALDRDASRGHADV
jgi:RimJ/RimL family protein N-acetyltransferase